MQSHLRRRPAAPFRRRLRASEPAARASPCPPRSGRSCSCVVEFTLLDEPGIDEVVQVRIEPSVQDLLTVLALQFALDGEAVDRLAVVVEAADCLETVALEAGEVRPGGAAAVGRDVEAVLATGTLALNESVGVDIVAAGLAGAGEVLEGLRDAASRRRGPSPALRTRLREVRARRRDRPR